MIDQLILHYQSSTGVGVDSRSIRPGELFFALKGERVDAHDKLEEVSARGVSASVVDRSYQGPSYGMQLIRVENVKNALQELARGEWAAQQPETLAITGSVGKTTTKDFIAKLISGSADTHVSPGNSNSQIGLPLSLLNGLKQRPRLLIQEMAMSLPGQIRRLTEICPPRIAAITAVELVHAENFASLGEIRDAKAEIFSSPHTKVGIVPHHLKGQIQTPFPLRTFSVSDPEADLFLTIDGKSFRFIYEGGEYSAPLPFQASHHFQNLAAALLVCLVKGAVWEELLARIGTLELPKLRMETVKKEGVTYIIDCYNASAIATKGALENLPQGDRKIAVIGTMPELGKFSKQCHLEVARHALERVDLLFCLGNETEVMAEEWKRKGREAEHFSSKQLLKNRLRETICEGDVVLIKGANRLQMWDIPYDDHP